MGVMAFLTTVKRSPARTRHHVGLGLGSPILARACYSSPKLSGHLCIDWHASSLPQLFRLCWMAFAGQTASSREIDCKYSAFQNKDAHQAVVHLCDRGLMCLVLHNGHRAPVRAKAVFGHCMG